MAFKLERGRLRQRITFERPVPDTSFDGAGAGTWEHAFTTAAEVQDWRMGKAENLDDGVVTSTRPTRIIIGWRPDVTGEMRIRSSDRVLQIVGNIVELGFRQALEITATEFSPASAGV